MIAGIDFKVYHNFAQYLTEAKGDSRYDYDYTKALEVLNEMLATLVKKNKLTFLYKRRRVKPILPLQIWECGNIFSEQDDEINLWENIQIKCELDCEYKDFDWEAFKVGVCPEHFCPTGKLAYSY